MKTFGVVGLVLVCVCGGASAFWWFVLRTDVDRIRTVLVDMEEAIEDNDPDGLLETMTRDVTVEGFGGGVLGARPWVRSSLGMYRNVEVKTREFVLDVGHSLEGRKTANVELEVRAWGEHVLDMGTRVPIHDQPPFYGRDVVMLRMVEEHGDWKIRRINFDP